MRRSCRVKEALETGFRALRNDLGVVQPVAKVSDAIGPNARPFLNRAQRFLLQTRADLLGKELTQPSDRYLKIVAALLMGSRRDPRSFDGARIARNIGQITIRTAVFAESGCPCKRRSNRAE